MQATEGPKKFKLRRRYKVAISMAVVFALWSLGVCVWFPQSPSKEMAKARTTEARAGLLALASAQSAHFKAHRSYSFDIREIGFRPDGQRTYVIGFPPACVQTHAPVLAESGVTNTLKLEGREVASSAMTSTDLTIAQRQKAEEALASLDRLGCANPAEGFTAFAVGNIDDDDDLDVWAINEKRELRHIQSDL